MSPSGLDKTSLLAWWEFEETSGTRTDSVSGLTLSEIGTVPRITGPGGEGYGVQLRNASNGGLIGTFDDFRHSGSYSVVSWINLGSGANVNNNIFGYGNGYALTSGKTDFRLMYGSASTAVRLYQGSSGAWRVIAEATIPGKTVWFHMAYTYDEPTGDYSITINGGTPVADTAVNPLVTTTSSPVGLYLADNGAFTLDCDIAQWSYWGRVLDSSEISYLYNEGVALPYSLA